jgi:hypothetical protein
MRQMKTGTRKARIPYQMARSIPIATINPIPDRGWYCEHIYLVFESLELD